MATKHVFRYLKGTIDYGLQYARDCNFNLVGYTDSDWDDNVPNWKSTSGCCFSLGSTVIAWRSRKQTSVVLSTMEAEYIAAYAANGEVVWLCKMLSGLFDLQLEATSIYCDNQNCIKLSENPVFHDKSKQIEIKYQYIRDLVEKGAVELHYIATDEQIADVLTKPLSRVKF